MWFLHGIIGLLIGAADVALMLVAVITVADAIGIRYLKNRPAVTARTRAWMAGKETMIMATTPQQEARHPLDYGTSSSGQRPGDQIEYDRVERRQVRRGRREARARERKERRELAAATIWLPALGVAIRDGSVYAWELSWSGPVTGRLLGSLAWAHAEAASGMADPVGLLARVRRKRYRGVAAVAFPDGNVWRQEFTDVSALIKVKAEAVRFNILAVGAAAETRPAGNGVASDLERLAALHTSGTLDDEEFRQAKACALTEGR